MTGAVHGNEVHGTKAMAEIIRQLDAGELTLLRGTLTCVPIVNPLAHQLNRREGDRERNQIAAYDAQGELCAGSFPPNAANTDWFASHRTRKRGDGPHFTLLKYTGPAAGSWVMVSREVSCIMRRRMA